MSKPRNNPEIADQSGGGADAQRLIVKRARPRTYRLRTFGVIDLAEGPSGRRVHQVVSQPKRLAMLVYVVCQPEQTAVRDKLLSVFFPETSSEKARHALSQAAYVLRRDLGGSAIRFQPGDRVSVDPSVIYCDAVELASHLECGEFEQALHVYAGDFLDGFHISGCSEFEDWLSRERDRLRNLAREAASRATRDALERGDLRSAIKYVHEWLRVTPYDEEAIRKLMAAHAERGDRAAAVLAYRQFEEQLARDLDLVPSAETKAHATRIADSIQHESRAVPGTGTLSPAREVHWPPAQERSPRASGTTAQNSGTRWRRRLTLATSLVVALVVSWFATEGREAPAATDRDEPPTIVVFPFAVHGPPEAQYLREGLPDLFFAKLMMVPGLRAVDPGTVRLRPAYDEDLTVRQLAALARQLGADQYIHGSVVVVGEQLQIRASISESRAESLAGETQALTGRESDLLYLIDQVAAQLLSANHVPPERRLTRVAAVTSRSYLAVRAYLDGERTFRRDIVDDSGADRFDAARQAYRRAIREDSTFALAYHRLAFLALYTNDLRAAKRWSDLATEKAQRLPPVYRLVVTAFAAFHDSRIAEAERLYRLALRERPDEREALLGLAEIFIHYNPLRGKSPYEALPYLEAALVDSLWHPSLTHLLPLAAKRRDGERVDALLRMRDSDSPHWLILGDLARGDDRHLTELLTHPTVRTMVAGNNIAHFVEDLSTGSRLIRAAASADLSAPYYDEVPFWVAWVEMARGRPRAAMQALQLNDGDSNAASVEAKAWFLSLPFVPVTGWVRDSIRSLLGGQLEKPGAYRGIVYPRHQEAQVAIRDYLLGLLYLRLGVVDTALHYSAKLSGWRQEPGIDSLTRDLARVIEARFLWEYEDDPVAALQVLEVANMMTPIQLVGSQFYGRNDLRFLRAELLRTLGRYEEAKGWHSGFVFGEPPADIVHLVPIHLGQAAIYHAQGDSTRARRHLNDAKRLWSDAEPVIHETLAGVREKLQLTGNH